jgi:hypothetical protein
VKKDSAFINSWVKHLLKKGVKVSKKPYFKGKNDKIKKLKNIEKSACIRCFAVLYYLSIRVEVGGCWHTNRRCHEV